MPLDLDELDSLDGLELALDAGVLTVTIDNGPINLFDLPLFSSFVRLSEALLDPGDVRVVVLESANPEFFIAHFDVEAIMLLPRDKGDEAPDDLTDFHAMVERFRTMPCVTIAKVAGIVRGGGCELIESVDMRFAARGRAVFGQPEVALGILPGGSGTQRLPRLIGRGRALEMVLGCDDIDADTADHWGLVNRALPPDQLDPFVDRLARRIAGYPPHAIAEAKASVVAADRGIHKGLLRESQRFNRLLGDDVSHERMQAFLDNGGQTREGELDLQHRLP